MIIVSTVEHAVAKVAHDVVVGAKATQVVLAKVAVLVEKDAPTVEAITALVDPRASVIEQIGAALIGEIEPQIAKVAGDVATEGTTPSVSLSVELVTELKALYASLSSEISTAKATL